MQKSYDILGINMNADEATVKKAYKNLAMKHHPDKGGDEARFKEISNAYDDICNPKPQFQSRMNPTNMNWTSQPAPARPHSRGLQTYVMKISLMEAIHGCEKKLSLTDKEPCSECIAICGTCNGSGLVDHLLKMPSFVQKMTRTCESCKGNGKRIMRQSCTPCGGKRTIDTNHIVVVKVPSGVNHNDKRSVLTSKNEQLVITFYIISEASGLRKEGCNLIFTKNIHFLDTFLGADIELPHPEGSFKITTEDIGGGIIVARKKYVAKKGYGSPLFPGSKNNQRGDYLVEFTIDYTNIKTPNLLDNNVKHMIRNMLMRQI